MTDAKLSYLIPNRRHGHLTDWTLGLLIRGETDAATRRAAEAHLHTCEACQHELSMRYHELESGLHNPLPASLAALLPPEHSPTMAAVRPLRPARGGLRQPLLGAMFILAACAVTVGVLSLRARDTQASTPAPPVVLATVQRDGAALPAERPLSNIQDLHPGDRLRLRLPGADPHARVTVETLDGEGWTLLFAGPLPTDGWLPTTLQWHGGASTLRLRTCLGDGSQCRDTTFTF